MYYICISMGVELEYIKLYEEQEQQQQEQQEQQQQHAGRCMNIHTYLDICYMYINI